MVVNPCCMPLQRGVRIMAIIDIIFDVINVIVCITAIVGVTAYDGDLNITKSEKDVALGVLIFMLIIAILGLLMSIRLLIGANRRDIRNCKIWLIVSIVIFTLNILSTILNNTAGDRDTAYLTTSILDILYRLYMMWVVYAFIQELKLEQQMMGFQARLEGGIGYSMGTYPPPPPQQQYPVYSGSAGVGAPPPPYPTVVISGAPQQQATPNGMYNHNNQYYTTGNI